MRYQIYAQNKVTRKMNKASSSSVLPKLDVPKLRVHLHCSAQSCPSLIVPLFTPPACLHSHWAISKCSQAHLYHYVWLPDHSDVIYVEFWAQTRFVRTELCQGPPPPLEYALLFLNMVPGTHTAQMNQTKVWTVPKDGYACVSAP